MVADAGADHLGLVVAQGAHTWDEVDMAEAREIFDAVRGRITTVCLLFDHEFEQLVDVIDRVRPDIIHLHHWTDEYPPGKLTLLRSAIPGTRVMITIPVRGTDSIDLAVRFDGAADFILLDTVDPDTGVVGATGRVHDWSVSRRIVEAVEQPVLVAGGLGPENVADVIAQVGPAGVDSQTATSQAGDRRRKDPDLVREFVIRAQVTASRE